MVARVIDALRDSARVSRIAVAIEDPALLRTVPGLGAMIEAGTILACQSQLRSDIVVEVELGASAGAQTQTFGGRIEHGEPEFA